MNKFVFYLLISMALISQNLFAQNVEKGFKQIEKQNWAKAEKIFNEIIVQNPNDVAANFGLAKVLSADGYENQDLFAAFEKVMIATAFYDQINQTKRAAVSKLFSAEAMQKEKNVIDDKLFESVKKTNKLPDAIKFLEQCSDSKHYEDAIKHRHKLEFWDAKYKNTADAYNEFIANFPMAEQVDEAKKIRNKMMFDKAKRSNRISEYTKFINQYPDAEQVEEAKKIRNSLEYKRVKIRNNLAAYEEFIKKYPDAFEADEARQYVYALAFRNAQQANTVENLNDFIEKYPKAPQIEKAKQLRNKLAIQEVESVYDPAEFDNYLEKYKGTEVYSKVLNLKAIKLGEEIGYQNKYSEYAPQWQKAFRALQMSSKAMAAAALTDHIVLVGKNNPVDKWYSDAWFLKCNTEGEVVWENNFGDVLDDVINCVYMTNQGNILACGHTDTKASTTGHVVILKYDTEGKLQWKQSMPGTDALGISGANDNNVAVCGYNSKEDGNRDFWVRMFSNKGKLLWEQVYPNSGVANSIAFTNNGEIVVLGNTRLIKLDTNGNKIWEKIFAEEIRAYGMASDGYGSIVLAGRSYNFKKENRSDYWVATYTEAGQKQWEKTFDRNNEFDNAFSVAVRGSEIFVAGLSSNNNDTDDDVWMLKLDSSGNKTSEILFGTEKNEKKPLVIAPANGELFLLTSIGLNSDIVLLKY